MNKLKKYVGIITALILTGLIFSGTSVVAEEFHHVYGYVYIDEVSYPGLTVNLSFSDDYGSTGYEENVTFGSGAFSVNFEGHTYDTCEFKVLYNSNWYTPLVNDSIEIPEDIGIQVNLYINTSVGNQPPGKVEGLTVTDKKDGKLGLSWTAATDDNNNVSKYLIYRDGSEIAIVTAPTTTYTDTRSSRTGWLGQNRSCESTRGNRRVRQRDDDYRWYTVRAEGSEASNRPWCHLLLRRQEG